MPAGGLAQSGSAGDHGAAVLRMRQVLLVGTVLWTSSIGLDWIASHRVWPGGNFAAMLALRSAQLAVLLVSMAILRRTPPPTPATTRRLWLTVFVGANLAQAGFTLSLGTIHGPYAHGASVILLAAGLVNHDPWRRGIGVLGPAAAAYPLTILAAAAWSARVRAQFADEVARFAFAIDVAVLVMAAALMVGSSHAFWSLRRELFETRRLGGYRLRARIAVGGMGEVWRAWHAALKREVAVKILRIDLADDAARARFEREAAATATLTHPHTIRVLDYGTTEDGLSYYAMELLDGETLQQMVEREGPLAPERVAYLIGDAAAALSEAHARGLVHRDLKPSNLMITTTGGQTDFVKVIDFGIARAADDRARHATALTQANMVVGTPAYMAPEQASGGAVDAAADVYALGAVAYFALTGQPAVHGSTPAAVMATHHESGIEPVALRAPHAVPDDVGAIVMRCLRTDRSQRYGDAAALAQAWAECSLARAWRPGRAPAMRMATPRASTPASSAEAVGLEPTRPLTRP